MTANQALYGKYLQPGDKDAPEINLKQSPLALLVQTCSSIESNLYSGAKPSFNGHYKPVAYQQNVAQTPKSSHLKVENIKSGPSRKVSMKTTDIKSKRVDKNDKKVLKRPSSQQASVKTTLSPKKQKLTPEISPTKPSTPTATTSNKHDRDLAEVKPFSPLYDMQHQQLSNFNHQANIQMQMMNPMHYYMKTIEDQLKSSQHVCNWMVNNVTCGKKFSTSDQLLSHLQTHAMTSQPSYPPISSLQTNQMLQSAYSLMQSQQNQLASMHLANPHNSLGALSMYNLPTMFPQGNFPMFPTKTPNAQNFYFPFNNVLS